MIKTLLKYKLAETAINTFFSKVSNNFTNVNICKFKVGCRIFKIHTKYTNIPFNTFFNEQVKYRYKTYYDCIIMDIYKNADNKEYAIVIKCVSIDQYAVNKDGSNHFKSGRFNNDYNRIYLSTENIIEVIP